MSQINLKKQDNSETFIPDLGYVGLFYSNELAAWAYKDEAGTVFPFAAVATQARSLYSVVRNQTGTSIQPLKVLYISGSSGTRPLVSLAQANSEATSTKTFAVSKSEIVNNSDAEVIVAGLVENVDTSAFSVGDSLWLSAIDPGGVTNVMPITPNHSVFIGHVVRSHPSLGVVEVSIQNGYELGELHDVLITTPQVNQSLKYDGSIWINKDTEYVHTQGSASTSWVVNHNLGFYPSVEILSVGFQEIEGTVTHNTINQTTISFETAIAGSARFN
jgi:hypothetical protein